MVCLSYRSDFEVARNCCVLLWFLETKTGGESLFWKEVTDGGVTTMFLWHGCQRKSNRFWRMPVIIWQELRSTRTSLPLKMTRARVTIRPLGGCIDHLTTKPLGLSSVA
jgi:hypothetical protein